MLFTRAASAMCCLRGRVVEKPAELLTIVDDRGEVGDTVAGVSAS